MTRYFSILHNYSLYFLFLQKDGVSTRYLVISAESNKDAYVHRCICACYKIFSIKLEDYKDTHLFDSILLRHRVYIIHMFVQKKYGEYMANRSTTYHRICMIVLC
jgi:hypothetical protein